MVIPNLTPDLLFHENLADVELLAINRLANTNLMPLACGGITFVTSHRFAVTFSLVQNESIGGDYNSGNPECGEDAKITLN